MPNHLPFERIQREILVRKKAKTDKKFGCNPDERTVQEHLDYGIISIYKPRGPTSHQTSAYAKHILGLKKTGHSGTLDPKVVGVLPVALGRGTRVVEALLNAGKEYVCIMHVHDTLDEKTIRDTMASFVGKIKQLPPIKSAVKRDWRYRKIYYLDIMEIDGPDVLFRVGCQAGTYIRKLCHDMGEKFGCGAHMAELIRTKAGPFNDKEMYTLQEVTDAFKFYKEGNETFIRKVIKPIEKGVAHLPKVWVFDSTVEPLCHGTNLAVPGISLVESDIQVDEQVAIMTLKNELVAVGTTLLISREMVNNKSGIAINVSKVFMQPGTYPKVTKENI